MGCFTSQNDNTYEIKRKPIRIQQKNNPQKNRVIKQFKQINKMNREQKTKRESNKRFFCQKMNLQKLSPDDISQIKIKLTKNIKDHLQRQFNLLKQQKIQMDEFKKELVQQVLTTYITVFKESVSCEDKYKQNFSQSYSGGKYEVSKLNMSKSQKSFQLQNNKDNQITTNVFNAVGNQVNKNKQCRSLNSYNMNLTQKRQRKKSEQLFVVFKNEQNSIKQRNLNSKCVNLKAQQQYHRYLKLFAKQVGPHFKKIFQFQKQLYPRNSIKKLENFAQKFQDFDLTFDEKQDLLHRLKIVFSSTDDNDITNKVKKFFNLLIDSINVNYEKFYQLARYQIFQVGPDQKDTQILSKFKIGRKLQKNAQKFTKLNTGKIDVMSSEVLRIIIKWIQNILQLIQKPLKYILKKVKSQKDHSSKILEKQLSFIMNQMKSTISKSKPFEMRKSKQNIVRMDLLNKIHGNSQKIEFDFNPQNKQVSKLSIQKQDNNYQYEGQIKQKNQILRFFDYLAQKEKNIKTYFQLLKQQEHKFEYNVLKVLSKMQNVCQQVPQQKSFLILFSHYNAKFVSWMIEEELIFLIKIFVQMKNYFKKIKKNNSQQKFEYGVCEKQILQIPLKFGVNDLLRCRYIGTKQQLLKIYNNFRRLQNNNKLIVLKIKNRFDKPLNDFMILFRFDQCPFICQCQLILKQESFQNQFNAGLKQKVNHFLYQLQRSIFGSIKQSSIYLRHTAQYVNYFKKIKIRTKRKEIQEDNNIQLCQKIHPQYVKQIEQNIPLICSKCCKYYQKYQNPQKIKQCRQCLIKVCNLCMQKNIFITQSLIIQKFQKIIQNYKNQILSLCKKGIWISRSQNQLTKEKISPIKKEIGQKNLKKNLINQKSDQNIQDQNGTPLRKTAQKNSSFLNQNAARSQIKQFNSHYNLSSKIRTQSIRRRSGQNIKLGPEASKRSSIQKSNDKKYLQNLEIQEQYLVLNQQEQRIIFTSEQKFRKQNIRHQQANANQIYCSKDISQSYYEKTVHLLFKQQLNFMAFNQQNNLNQNHVNVPIKKYKTLFLLPNYNKVINLKTQKLFKTIFIPFDTFDFQNQQYADINHLKINQDDYTYIKQLKQLKRITSQQILQRNNTPTNLQLSQVNKHTKRLSKQDRNNNEINIKQEKKSLGKDNYSQILKKSQHLQDITFQKIRDYMSLKKVFKTNKIQIKKLIQFLKEQRFRILANQKNQKRDLLQQQDVQELEQRKKYERSIIYFCIVCYKKSQLIFKCYKLDIEMSKIINVYQHEQSYELNSVFYVSDLDVLFFINDFDYQTLTFQSYGDNYTKLFCLQQLCNSLLIFQGQSRATILEDFLKIDREQTEQFIKQLVVIPNSPFNIVVDIYNSQKQQFQNQPLIKYLQSFPGLKHLTKPSLKLAKRNISTNQIKQMVSQLDSNFQWMQYIKQLNLSQNQISSITLILSENAFQQLEILNTSKNQLSEIKFQKSSNLRQFNAEKNKLLLIDGLMYLDHLQILNLKQNKIQDKGFFPSSKKLKYQPKQYEKGASRQYSGFHERIVLQPQTRLRQQGRYEIQQNIVKQQNINCTLLPQCLNNWFMQIKQKTKEQQINIQQMEQIREHDFRSIKKIYLDQNQLKLEKMYFLSQQLEVLSLSSNKINKIQLLFIGSSKFKRLKQLYLNNNNIQSLQFSKYKFEYIRRNPPMYRIQELYNNLERVELNNNKLTQNEIQYFLNYCYHHKLKKLQHLSFQNNLIRSIPKLTKQFSSKKLQYLSLKNNFITNIYQLLQWNLKIKVFMFTFVKKINHDKDKNLRKNYKINGSYINNKENNHSYEQNSNIDKSNPKIQETNNNEIVNNKYQMKKQIQSNSFVDQQQQMNQNSTLQKLQKKYKNMKKSSFLHNNFIIKHYKIPEF